jgi:Predicted permeases
MSLKLWHYPVLFLVGLIAGTVDAIAGGGGLITVPALLNLGLPVPLALGTNKFQSSFGSVSASIHFLRCRAVTLRECRLGIFTTLVGSLLGAFAVQQIDSDLLANLVPWLLAAILLYTLLRPQIGTNDHPPKLSVPLFFTGFGLTLGFYDGFFGPGTGSFWAIALILVLGQNFARATAFTKIMNATSNLAALALFLIADLVHFGAGLAMAAGQLLGGKLGAHLVVTRGARFIRPIFLVMVTLTLARLLWLNFTKTP